MRLGFVGVTWRRLVRLFPSFLSVLAVAASCQADDLVIVEAGRSAYEIVLDPGAWPTTRLAAEELARFLHRGTGVSVPIVTAATKGVPHIYISSTDQLKPHGFAIQVQGRDLFLRGRDSAGSDRTVDYVEPVHRGTCHAVYEFLERFGGVRWYWGDELGEVVPRLTRVAVPSDTVIKQEPRFEYRALNNGPPETLHGDWARRNRLGAATTMRHSHELHRLVKVEEWAARGHPEYAALINGKRKTTAGGHVCTGNPEVVRLVSEAARAHFVQHPQRKMFSISPPDGSSMCGDELCTRYDVPDYKVPRGERRGKPVKTDRILHFYNEVAGSVARNFPDRLLGGIVYGDYLYPPRRELGVHPMMALFVAPNVAVNLWDDDAWAFCQELNRSWGRFHNRVYAYDTLYRCRRAYGLPAPMGERAVDLVRLYAEAGIRGAYLYVGPTWEAQGPEAYLLAKLLWDPDADVDAIRREYFGVLYQKAAKPVREYFDIAQECWKRATVAAEDDVASLSKPFHQSKDYAEEEFARLLLGYASRLEDLEDRVRDAEQLAADDPLVSRRVVRLRDNFELTKATVVGLQAVVRYEQDPGHDAKLLQPLVQAIKAREALLKRTQHSYAADLEEQLRFADKNADSPLQMRSHYHRLAAQNLAP